MVQYRILFSPGCDWEWDYSNTQIKGVLHLPPQKAPKLACFVLYLKIINIFLKNNYMHLIANLSKELKNSINIKVGQAVLKGALDKFNIIPNFFPKKVGIFTPLEVLAWVKTACRVLHSIWAYFWRIMNISSIFFFSKSTSLNTQYSSLWGTLKMMLFTKYLIKWKRIGRISWNFRYWFDFKSSIELGIVQCPFKLLIQNQHFECFDL